MDFFRHVTFFYMSLFGFSLFTVYLFVDSVVTGRNEVGPRWCFYRHLWFCPRGVSSRETPQAGRIPLAGRTPPAGRTPRAGRPPPSRENPPAGRPPWQVEPPDREIPPPRGRETPPPRHTVNERPVRILLECILVDFTFTLSLGSAQTDPNPVNHYDNSIG